MYIGNIVLLILNLPLIPYIAKVLTIPRTYLNTKFCTNTKIILEVTRQVFQDFLQGFFHNAENIVWILIKDLNNE